MLLRICNRQSTSSCPRRSSSLTMSSMLSRISSTSRSRSPSGSLRLFRSTFAFSLNRCLRPSRILLECLQRFTERMSYAVTSSRRAPRCAPIDQQSAAATSAAAQPGIASAKPGPARPRGAGTSRAPPIRPTTNPAAILTSLFISVRSSALARSISFLTSSLDSSASRPTSSRSASTPSRTLLFFSWPSCVDCVVRSCFGRNSSPDHLSASGAARLRRHRPACSAAVGAGSPSGSTTELDLPLVTLQQELRRADFAAIRVPPRARRGEQPSIVAPHDASAWRMLRPFRRHDPSSWLPHPSPSRPRPLAVEPHRFFPTAER